MSKRLLILIDSEPVTSRTLALDLAEAGYEVETAEDDREALRKLESVPFDLLIATDGPGDDVGIVARMRRCRSASVNMASPNGYFAVLKAETFAWKRPDTSVESLMAGRPLVVA